MFGDGLSVLRRNTGQSISSKEEPTSDSTHFSKDVYIETWYSSKDGASIRYRCQHKLGRRRLRSDLILSIPAQAEPLKDSKSELKHRQVALEKRSGEQAMEHIRNPEVVEGSNTMPTVQHIMEHVE